MTIITYLLTFVEIICSLLLLIVILIQRTKSQGMGMAFGGSMGETLFGSQVGNVLTRSTVILAFIFLANTTLLAVIESKRTAPSVTDTTEDVPAAIPTGVPSGPGGPPPGGFAPAPAPAPVAAPVAPPVAAPVVPDAPPFEGVEPLSTDLPVPPESADAAPGGVVGGGDLSPVLPADTGAESAPIVIPPADVPAPVVAPVEIPAPAPVEVSPAPPVEDESQKQIP